MRKTSRTVCSIVLVFFVAVSCKESSTARYGGNEYYVSYLAINGKPTPFVIDTCSAESLWVSRPFTAENNLNVVDEGPPFVHLDLGFGQKDRKFRDQKIRVVDMGPFGMNGAIGWTWLQSELSRVSSETKRVTFLKALPKDISNWQKLAIKSDESVLLFEAQTENGRFNTVSASRIISS